MKRGEERGGRGALGEEWREWKSTYFGEEKKIMAQTIPDVVDVDVW